MIQLIDGGVYLHNGREVGTDIEELRAKYGNVPSPEEAKRGTMAFEIIKTHNSGDGDALRLKFDAMASHDITFVSVVQTAKASGLKKFPVPYVLTNCHNSLCAVGGTINEDDHRFGLSAARKYGGIYVPPHIAVIHQYMREAFAGCGKMIIGTDSHTRYGALGTMAIGEGGGEVVKQLLCKTYDVRRPGVVAVRLTGKPAPGVGAQDVALAIIGATFKNAFVKNKVMEFVGEGIAHLSMDFRNGVDVMTTETSCLSSIWETDEKTGEYLEKHGRAADYKKLAPAEWAYYDAMVDVDLSKVRPMIALPFHPSNTFAIDELRANAGDILRKVEKDAVQSVGREIKLTDKVTAKGIKVDQGVIAGCAGGTFENIMFANTLLGGQHIGCGEFALSVYPASQPILLELMAQGATAGLIKAGATLRTAFCGPCFGAGDVPFSGALSVRHTTRNFPHREGSRPGDGQMASVALMDARSIAATAANGGILTPATDFDCGFNLPEYTFDRSAYDSRVYNGWGKALTEEDLAYGPNIVDWPPIPALEEDILLRVVASIDDPVTTTDELIPSGETSSYRSNPLRLAEYTLSRKDPAYVGRAKEVLSAEKTRGEGKDPAASLPGLEAAYGEIAKLFGGADRAKIGLGSVIYAVKPGDGSAREQAASCQRVLGGSANIAQEYATKRYRSNLINWGMVPFTMREKLEFAVGDYIYIPGIKRVISDGETAVSGYVLGKNIKLALDTGELTGAERRILLAGCLINDYRES